eukprot:GHRR01026597.1.p1 GENE.GHRR01026597.1~~GHRR01026597.1.p1  ORF type:complete len:167 (-),score=23.01 GHRR01026597.1:28-528(-)
MDLTTFFTNLPDICVHAKQVVITSCGLLLVAADSSLCRLVHVGAGVSRLRTVKQCPNSSDATYRLMQPCSPGSAMICQGCCFLHWVLHTGHLDGTLCLWDLRQNRAGSQPLAEVRDHSQAILCLSPTSHSDRLLTASKDHQLRVWDFRQLGAVQVTVCRHDSLMVR